MNNAKVAAIKNERERYFAATFFDHDDWDHHPDTIHFEKGKYTADFYDRRRGVYIEVVGTRQAFAANKYKYLYLMDVCKNITLEFRSHDGKLLDPYNLSLACGCKKQRVAAPNANLLEIVRVEKNLTFEQLGNLVGLDRTVVWKHCRKNNAVPAEAAIKYSAALGVPLSELRPDLPVPVLSHGTIAPCAPD